MPTDSETENIEIDLVLEAVHAKYGYDLRRYTRESMRRRLLAVLGKSGAAHFGELQHRILTDRGFFVSVLDALTVQVSEMFRDPSFYAAFRKEVIPLLRTYPRLKIWHAGCAGGEEAYATSILLTEEKLYERAQIYATDVSPGALERAREAVYTASNAVTFASNYEQSGGTSDFAEYCSHAYGRVTIKEALRKNVVFFQHDLVSDYTLGQMHVIFCRNVLIYFAPSLRKQILSMFAQSLARGGFLCLGASERLSGEVLDMFTEFVPEERIYRLRNEP